MVRIRAEIESIRPYAPGRRIDEIARQIGIDAGDIVKLASNESPDGPFPGVLEAVTLALVSANRYPDNDLYDLSGAVASALGVAGDNLLFGAGTTGLLGDIAAAVGGNGTHAVYAWPSFVMYRIITRWAGGDPVEVPVDADHRLDLGAVHAAIDDDTTVVYLCNPNNPTGTVLAASTIEGFIAAVPQHVLVVVDEAYHDFVTDPDYRSAIDLAVARPNVLVTRTFSKIYALAGLRIGYAVGHPELLVELRKAQAPFTVNQVAQSAALASLGQPEELARRATANAAGRSFLLDELADRGVEHATSQANFVYCRLSPGSVSTADALTQLGVIVRPMSEGWVRVTVGSPDENDRFLAVIDDSLAGR